VRRKKTRLRTRKQQRKDQAQRDTEKVLELYDLFWSLSEAAQQFVEHGHLPVVEYGDLKLFHKSLDQRIITVGLNPAPLESEKNVRVTGGVVAQCMDRLINCEKNVPIEIQEFILDAGHDYFLDRADGREPANIHSYFRSISKIGNNSLSASYFESKKTVRNFMVHIDVCPFATTVKWGQLPVKVQEELLSKSNIVACIQYLKPNNCNNWT